ncbi:MAG TPA: hypothetical protein PLK94_11585 [Alphaproteobacteria bacterium]|nr:hypothetical protein [Alphaproteobacteria bacterium]
MLSKVEYVKLRFTLAKLGLLYSCTEITHPEEMKDYVIGEIYERNLEKGGRVIEMVTHVYNVMRIRQFIEEHYSYATARKLFDSLAETAEVQLPLIETSENSLV